MKKTPRDGQDLPDLDRLIEEIGADANGEDEKFWAFRQAFENNVSVPCDGFVIGEPVSVLEFDYDGNERRGLTARCRHSNGSEHVVAALDVVLSGASSEVRYLAAYRKWMGLDPSPPSAGLPHLARQHKAAATDLDMKGPVELVVLAVKENAVRCKLPGTDRVITLRANQPENAVPGEVIVVRPNKQWRYAGHPYLSGVIESVRLDVAALAFVPLKLDDQGIWVPEDHYWGEDGEPIEEWVKPIIARGPRQEFEMEQVLPGWDPTEYDSDPITDSNELKQAGDFAGARKLLMDLCQADLRCLDAHTHLGNLVFDRRPEVAIRHYEVGLRIGELSLGPGFDGLLPWGLVDNRPFLRCMHGFGLCQWRFRRFDEAHSVFDRMLWLNPSDNQGVRFIIEEVRSKKPWVDR
jgi:hypothetical protein